MISDNGKRAGLEKAAAIIAKAVKARAATFSETIPPTVRSYIGRDKNAYVEAGGPDGKAAPAAYMAQTPGARHMLFGNRKHWYDQPYRPFMDEAIAATEDEALDAFADEAIDKITKEAGYH